MKIYAELVHILGVKQKKVPRLYIFMRMQTKNLLKPKITFSWLNFLEFLDYLKNQQIGDEVLRIASMVKRLCKLDNISGCIPKKNHLKYVQNYCYANF